MSSTATTSRPIILLTGSSGFVAAHVLNSLLKHGYSVRGTVRNQASANKVWKRHSHLLDGDNSRLTFVNVQDVAQEGAFDEAVKGVDGVIHTASPFTTQVEDNERDLLEPAIKGTTEILKAVKAHAPQVKRVVITSSFAAIVDLSKGLRPGYTYYEKDWNPITYEEAKNGNGRIVYVGSKTFAEKAAWEFVEKEKPNFSISTINPPMIYGPLEQDASIDHLNTSSKDIYRFIDGSQQEPGPTSLPAFADVRDVGEAHVLAYQNPISSRYLVSSGSFQYPDMCTVLKKHLPPELADNVPDPEATSKVETFIVDNTHAREVLGLEFVGFDETIKDAAGSLVKLWEEGKGQGQGQGE
ncbi:MAG: hypothetical protein LQ342_001379 [Letrouitia transgressa]|nr:MAG: hypothetical protein LQ342_001379 [Letrouitia transgressa]